MGSTYEISVLFGRDPDVAVAPSAQISKLLNFFVVVSYIVFDRETDGIENADVAAQTEEDTGTFVSEEFGI